MTNKKMVRTYFQNSSWNSLKLHQSEVKETSGILGCVAAEFHSIP